MQDTVKSLTHTRGKWHAPTFVIAAALCMALYCSGAFAQSGAGSIQGTVTDVTSAVIPGASIHVVNQATGVVTDTKSDSVGFYQVPELFTGTYAITVTAPGMKTYKTMLELLVDQKAVINPVLTAGAVTQQVEVSGNAVQLTTTDSGTIATALENARISQLPMNGRELTTLVSLVAPGVEGGQRSNGLMPEALEYVADGVTLSDRQFGGMNQAQAQAPDPDAVQELRIETANTSAQYSEPGTVLITTKSGTNSLHGSLFETARNNAIGAAKGRTTGTFVLPHLVRNEFGASVGGPIVLPHVYHGKDKSFWFLAFEKYSLASSTPENVTVPTPAMRQGDFSGLVSAGIPQILYDFRTTQNSASCAANGGKPNAYCRTPFPNNQIPISLLSPTMKILYDITQLPSTDDNPFIHTNLGSPDINNDFIPTWTFRLDHVFNETNRAYLRYTSNNQNQTTLRNYPSNSPYTIAADGFPFQASGVAVNPTTTYATALNYTHVFSPTFFAETVASQQWFSQHNFAGGTPLADFEQKLGLPNNFGEPGFPEIGSNLITPYGGTQFVYGISQIVSTLDENLTKTVGRHQMQFGGRYRHERFGFLPNEYEDTTSFGAQATGVWDVTTANWGSVPNTGNANGDAFVGAASGYSVNLEPPYAHFHDMEFDAYFQDNFHMRKNLTLNLGLRWEAHPATWLKGGTMEAFDLKNDALVLASTPQKLISEGYTTQAIITNLQWLGVKIETPQEAGLPEKLVYDYDLNFVPRFGFAYLPFGSKHGTVLRGGYGRYIYPIPVYTTYKPIQQNIPYRNAYSQSYSSAAQSPDGQANYLLRVNPLPVVMGVNSSNVVNSSTTTALLPGENDPYTLNPLQPPDFVTEVNVTAEQPLMGNSALRVSYVYSHGTNLDQEYYYNTHPSTFTWEVQTGTKLPTGTVSVIGTPKQNTYSATGTGTYDKTTWGGNVILDQKSGWSTDQSMQVDYERLYHHGVAYQISYVWSKPFRVGGNYFRDSIIYSAAAFGDSGVSTWQIPTGSVGTVGPYRLPPARPAGIAPYAYWHGLDSWEDKKIDDALPKHHIKFNGLYDLPFGTGKRFMGNSNRWMNMVVGGFQLAGDGTIGSSDFLVGTGDYGPVSAIHIYKHSKPITDCQSGVCRKAYYWFNGYIPPSLTTGCVKNCISGLPAGVQPYEQPIDTNYNPVTPGGTAADKYYNTSTVQINLTGGAKDYQGFSPSPFSNAWNQKIINGPFNWTIDLSLFKTIPLNERVSLRFNFDAFNALNMQGYTNPDGTSGEEQMTSSANTPRQVQLSLRLQF